LFDVNWSRKIKITINGKEYARLEDVPEKFRTQFKNIVRPGIPNASQSQSWKTGLGIKFDVGSQPLNASLGIPIPPPVRFHVDDDGFEKRISWRWFSWHAMRGILFAAIFSVPSAFMFYAYRNSTDNAWRAAALAIALLFALPGAATIYVWFAYLINRTRVDIDSTRVSICHGPLPMLRTRTVARNEINDVVSESVINDSESSDGSIFQPEQLYRVKLILKNGKVRKLVNGLHTPDQALFIEQEIRKVLLRQRRA
jgi:hypothetical protein